MSRPKNTEVENENVKVPAASGRPPRSASEPAGDEGAARRAPTATDPASGESKAPRR
jgi:hypothetical protein